MIDVQTTKTCRKKRTRKDRLTAERTTAKNSAVRAARHARRAANHFNHLLKWAAANGARVSAADTAKEIRIAVRMKRTALRTISS
jgi:hypothetical protein